MIPLLCVFALPEVKVGVINAQKIVDKSKKGAAIQKSLEKFQEEKKAKLMKMQDELEKLRKELTSPALNNETRNKKTMEFQTKQKEAKRYYEDAQNEFQQEYQKQLIALEKELMPLIENLGKSKGFTIIFEMPGPGIAFFDNAIDVTDEVIKALDAKY
jgi:outer membrane protein